MIPMTEEERQLLQSVLPHKPGRNDNSQDHIEEAFRQLRSAKDYLDRKYPGVPLVFHTFDPQTKMTERGFALVSVKGKSAVYRVLIRRAGDRYICSDTLYSEFIREQYDAALEQCLLPFAGPVKVHTVFHTPAGEKINADTPLSAVLAHQPRLVRHTDIYTEMPFGNEEELMKKLREGGFYGSYTVFLGDEKEFSFLEFRVQSERKNETV